MILFVFVYELDNDSCIFFLVSTELKRVSILGLDVMPKVTDAAFGNVVPHFKLFGIFW